MKKLRDILTVLVFVGLFIFFGICNGEILEQEKLAMENIEEKEIVVSIDEKLEKIVDNYNIDIFDLQLVHDKNLLEDDKYKIELKLALDEEEISLEKLESISDKIAYKLNYNKLSSEKLSHLAINWNSNFADAEFNYKIGSFNPEVIK